jgi:hypothetical protein
MTKTFIWCVLELTLVFLVPTPLDSNFSVCGFVSHTWTEDAHVSTTVTAIAVCLAVFIYDYFLTFRREVELVWLSQWNVIKVLFLAQRYFPIVDGILLSMIGK